MTAPGRPDTQSAHAAALSCLPGMGPATLVRILGRFAPTEAWEEIRAGRLVRPPQRGPATRSGRAWAPVARSMDPAEWWAAHHARGVGVTWLGRPDFPEAFAADRQPPGVLFWRGDLVSLAGRCVAIVGTRDATPDGRAVAFEMGRDLTAAGVCVVSGLALGIDGAAHAGALAAIRVGEARIAGTPAGTTAGVSAGTATASGRAGPAPAGPVGVAASGVDVPYPRRHADLWEEVVRAGAVISETPPGRPAQAWRFPSRNRLIAAAVDMVVVVESHASGGSLITAEAAIDRGVEVRVVPGPVHSAASAGSNQLLYDGPGPVRDARDVLDALGIVRPDGPSRAAAPTGAGGGPPLPIAARTVLAALGWRPAHPGQLMSRTGLAAATVARSLDELATAGLVTDEGGWWSRRR